MLASTRIAAILLALTLGATITSAPRSSDASVAQAVMALAGPLAQNFGVPASAVTGLLESGLSLESVTQLLLVSQSSETDLDAVAKRYNEAGNDITKTAEGLDVKASKYSEKKVQKAIDAAKADAQKDATKKANNAVSGAIDSALGGVSP